MADFHPGEIVRIMEPKKYSHMIYIIEKVRKIRKGGHLYLLKSLEDGNLSRLHYENEASLLERIIS